MYAWQIVTKIKMHVRLDLHIKILNRNLNIGFELLIGLQSERNCGFAWKISKNIRANQETVNWPKYTLR
ncbi:hypothetical protein CU320_12970 [Acinetobacter pseudolwoffii]|uniref:Uncharacterized protein n=1 Tax=Acinetobacter pseudolwoffii TaxID=2053287 RepID=A0A2H9UIU4_9GAMM|nr:hypothetical protein CU320_12970 [Acinetobacter pseudolwoffii]